jgi:hypothetical protein
MAQTRPTAPQSAPQTARQRSTDPLALPQFGMAAGTPVLTLDGALPVEFLTPGDRVLTRTGLRRLKTVEMTRLAQARMVRVAPHVLGKSRPDAPVWLLPSQLILLRDWRAKALYGATQVLVPIERMADGDYVRLETLDEARVYTLKLDDDAVIYAGGLELAAEVETTPA